jgi:hypothetical protein
VSDLLGSTLKVLELFLRVLVCKLPLLRLILTLKPFSPSTLILRDYVLISLRLLLWHFCLECLAFLVFVGRFKDGDSYVLIQLETLLKMVLRENITRAI